MIFITVGTHEQGFDRLIREVDELIENKEIEDDVFAQIGYSKYKPKYLKYTDMLGEEEMDKYVAESKIIITHGGPGSIFKALEYGKIPIVVPRDPSYNEHVDNHQILFVNKLESIKKVIAVYDVKKLKKCIENYQELAAQCSKVLNNTDKFVGKFDKLIKERLNLV